MMNISDTTHLTNLLRKITLIAGILAVTIFSGSFILQNLDSNAEELIPISAPIQTKRAINTSNPLPLNISVLDYLTGFDPNTMTIIVDEESVEIITRHGNTSTKIETKDGYIWEDGTKTKVYTWNAIPNQQVPYFTSETEFIYDGEEHCVTLMYEDKFITLADTNIAPQTPEEERAHRPVLCATEPGDYYIYAFVYGEMAWMDGSHGAKELIWKIIKEQEEPTPEEPTPEEPEPEEPTPEEPTPEEPEPEEPTPEEPTPEEPTPEEPTPEEPTPEEPTPEEPTPEEPTPEEPKPEEPKPEEPEPEEPEETISPEEGKGGSEPKPENDQKTNVQVPNTGVVIDNGSIVTETIFIITLAAATTYLLIKTARKDSN